MLKNKILLAQLFIVLDVFLIIVNAYVGFSTDWLPEAISDPNSRTTYVIAVTIVLLILAEKARSYHLSEWMRDQFSDIRNAVGSVKDAAPSPVFVNIGTEQQFFTTFNTIIADATQVKNIFVGFMRKSPKQHKQAQDPRLTTAYRNFFELNRTAIWKDLVGYKDAFDARFKMPFDKELVGDRHYVGVLRHNTPIINFMIVYGDGGLPLRVIFGWVYFDRDPKDVHLFMSTDKYILKTFHDYFESLWNERTLVRHEKGPIDYGIEPSKRRLNIDVVDKVGLWFICAYIGNRDRLKLDSLALVDIRSDGVQTHVNGTFVTPEFQHANHVLPDPKQVFTSANQMYYEYNFYESTHKPEDAFCKYTFTSEYGLFGEDDNVDILQGFYVDNRSGNQRKLLGVRAEELSISQDGLTGLIPTVANRMQPKIMNLIERRTGKKFS